MIPFDSQRWSRADTGRVVLVTDATSGRGAAAVTAARSVGSHAVGIDAAACPAIDHGGADTPHTPQLGAAVDPSPAAPAVCGPS